LIGTLSGDFRRLFSTNSVRVAAVFGSAALTAMRWDVPATREMHELPQGVFAGGNAAGALWTQLAAAGGTWIIGKTADRPPLAALGSELLRAQVVSQTIVQGLKRASHRTRPDATNSLSFPSGHTASAFATATVLERRFGWTVGVPAYALSSYVASARIATNKHYLSDVLIGAAIGIAAGRTVSIGSATRAYDLGIAPLPGGAAIVITKK
jgi:membrane-associated phospholipid phosphatase